MRFFLLLFLALFFICGCSVKHSDFNAQDNDIKSLALAIAATSSSVDKDEAYILSKEAIIYSKYLANEYGLVAPASFHNFLVNIGARDKGLCYHFAEDMRGRLEELNLQTIDILWAVANRGEYFEHNALVVVPKNGVFYDGVLLDAWRNSSTLYWSKVGDDKDYIWIEDVEWSKTSKIRSQSETSRR